jgi:acetyl esterase/lipase
MRFLLPMLALLVLGGCSAVDALNRLSSDAGLRTTLDIAYGPGPRGRLDVYAPADARGAPVVVFFYGGSWQEGDRASYGFVARALAEAGIVVVVPDYRVYPDVRFAGFMSDAARAIAWTHRTIARFGGDPNRIVLMGHSAGAHIAAVAALDPRWLAAEGLNRNGTVAGLVGLAGPYDFLPTEDPNYQDIFGTRPGSPPGAGRDTQPANLVGRDPPPAFLATGSLDTVVRPRNTETLAARLSAAGGRVQTRFYPGLGHRTLIGVLSQPLGFASSVRRDVTDFVLSVRPVGGPPGSSRSVSRPDRVPSAGASR